MASIASRSHHCKPLAHIWSQQQLLQQQQLIQQQQLQHAPQPPPFVPVSATRSSPTSSDLFIVPPPPQQPSSSSYSSPPSSPSSPQSLASFSSQSSANTTTAFDRSSGYWAPSPYEDSFPNHTLPYTPPTSKFSPPASYRHFSISNGGEPFEPSAYTHLPHQTLPPRSSIDFSAPSAPYPPASAFPQDAPSLAYRAARPSSQDQHRWSAPDLYQFSFNQASFDPNHQIQHQHDRINMPPTPPLSTNLQQQPVMEQQQSSPLDPLMPATPLDARRHSHARKSDASFHLDADAQNKKLKTNVNTELYKTELCSSFVKSGGYCPYGEKCQFAHGEDELKTIDRPANWRSKPCQNWLKTGKCAYNERCCFRHD